MDPIPPVFPAGYQPQHHLGRREPPPRLAPRQDGRNTRHSGLRRHALPPESHHPWTRCAASGLLTGLPAYDPTALTLTGADPALPSGFAVGTIAQTSIAATALAAAALHQARGGPAQRVAVDMRHAVTEFRSERHMRIDGAPAPELWDELAGLYPTADGHVRLHTNFPHHRAGILRLLGCAPTRDAVAQALLGWQAEAFETAAAEAGMLRHRRPPLPRMGRPPPRPGPRHPAAADHRAHRRRTPHPAAARRRPPPRRAARARPHPRHRRPRRRPHPGRPRRRGAAHHRPAPAQHGLPSSSTPAAASAAPPSTCATPMPAPGSNPSPPAPISSCKAIAPAPSPRTASAPSAWPRSSPASSPSRSPPSATSAPGPTAAASTASPRPPPA